VGLFRRTYYQWQPENTERVVGYFTEFINALGEGAKGPLPGE